MVSVSPGKVTEAPAAKAVVEVAASSRAAVVIVASAER